MRMSLGEYLLGNPALNAHQKWGRRCDEPETNPPFERALSDSKYSIKLNLVALDNCAQKLIRHPAALGQMVERKKKGCVFVNRANLLRCKDCIFDGIGILSRFDAIVSVTLREPVFHLL